MTSIIDFASFIPYFKFFTIWFYTKHCTFYLAVCWKGPIVGAIKT